MNARAKLSSKGQLVIPKSVREAHGWDEGTEFEFVESDRGVMIQAVKDFASQFPPISKAELLSRGVKIDRFPTDAEIEEALLAEAARRFDASRN